MKKRLVALGSALALLLTMSSCVQVRAQLYTYVCKTVTMAGARPAPCQAPAGLHTVKDTGVSSADTVTLNKSGTCNFATAVEWQAGCTPYAANSIWNRKITNFDNPIIYANSDAVMANIALSNGYVPIAPNTGEYGNSDNISHPVVFTTGGPNDVQVHARCRTYCNGFPFTDSVGAYGVNAQGVGVPDLVWIPKKARPATGSDHHLAIVQPDGTELDFFGAVELSNGVSLYWQPATGQTSDPEHDWTSSDILFYGGGQTMGNFYTGPGQISTSVANAAVKGGAALGAGLIRQAELAAGVIPHALFMLTGCADISVYVYPAYGGSDNACSGTGAQVPYGAHFWFRQTDAQIDALPNVTADQKTILHALHQYGAYIMDAGGDRTLTYSNVLNIDFEDGSSFSPFGVVYPMDTYAQAHGWATQIIQIPEYYLVDNSGINWNTQLRIVDPCYAQQTC